MRRFAALTIGLSLILGVVWLQSPAQAKIGPVTIPLGVSNGYVLWENFVGDRLGRVRDDVAGVSLYWADYQPIEFVREQGYPYRSGVLFSIYTIQALQILIAEGQHDLAYTIAQNAFDKIQQRWGWGGSGYKLAYPLKIMVGISPSQKNRAAR